MVVFTCNNCGESVKKVAVEKHYNTKCRGNNINVSCMDCQKDFLGKDHVAHTKCITEAEKYSAKGFVPKANKNTNAKKQDSWINVVQGILENSDYKLNGRTREALKKISNHENVPRKKVKFENFATKCLRMQQVVVKEVWTVLEKELKKLEEERQKNVVEKTAKAKQDTVENSQENALKRENTESSEAPVKKKKKKDIAQTEELAESAVVENESITENVFSWEDTLKKIIEKKGDVGISLDKLKSKVLKKYKLKLELNDVTEVQQKKFDKKFAKHLKKCTNVMIENDVAKVT